MPAELSRPVEETPESFSSRRFEQPEVRPRRSAAPEGGNLLGFLSKVLGVVLLLVMAAVLVWLGLTKLPGRTMREWEAKAAELVNPLTRKFGVEPFRRDAVEAAEPKPAPPSPSGETGAPLTVRPALPVPSEPELEPAPPLASEPLSAEESSPVEPPSAALAEVTPPTPASSTPPSLLPDLAENEAEETGATASPAAQEAALVEPLKALDGFLQARNWTERQRYSLDGDRLRTVMRQYYRTKDGPERHTSALFRASSTLPDSELEVHVFHVTFPDLPEGFPISVVQTANGWKVDWEAFVEFRDSRLKKFLTNFQDAPGTFRVRLERWHYFDNDVPDLDNKYCFRVAAPIDGHEGYVFLDKNDSIAGPKVQPYLEWEQSHYITVKLKWVKGLKNHNYVELRDIVSPSWRDHRRPAGG